MGEEQQYSQSNLWCHSTSLHSGDEGTAQRSTAQHSAAQRSAAQLSTAHTWGFSPVSLQGLGVGAQPLILVHVHLVGNVEVCAVEASL